MRDPSTLPALRLVLNLGEGETLERSWTMADAPSPEVLNLSSPPEWLIPIRKTWDHPQDPVTFEAGVTPGAEVEARAWFEALP